jgi:hypothetical protein
VESNGSPRKSPMTRIFARSRVCLWISFISLYRSRKSRPKRKSLERFKIHETSNATNALSLSSPTMSSGNCFTTASMFGEKAFLISSRFFCCSSYLLFKKSVALRSAHLGKYHHVYHDLSLLHRCETKNKSGFSIHLSTAHPRLFTTDIKPISNYVGNGVPESIFQR